MAASSERKSTDDTVLARARAAVEADQRFRDGKEDTEIPPEYHDSGCQVELSNMDLHTLPEELVDILKEHVKWLALHKNCLMSLSGLGPRFHEFNKLKYLNMRHNRLTEFPREILSISTMEMLDLRDNDIDALPEDLDRLANLKKFSLIKNKVTKLPLCITSMSNLAYLMVTSNPITFPPPAHWRLIESKAKLTKGETTELELRETKTIKKLLLEYRQTGRFPGDGDNGEEDANAETPKPARPNRHNQRFPINPSKSSIDMGAISRSESPRPPPIPNKAHSRVPTGPRSAALRPGFDLQLNSAQSNERNRSNSEGLMGTSTKQKRMGVYSNHYRQKTNTEQVRGESKSYQMNHSRGLSFGSALQNGNGTNGISADTPVNSSPVVEGETPRGTFVHRLSILPENKRKSQMNDPRIMLSQAVVFTAHQLRFPLEYLVKVVGMAGNKGPAFERSVSNLFIQVDGLSAHLTSFERSNEETEDEEMRKSPRQIQSACSDCLQQFQSLISSLMSLTPVLMQQADPRYIRSLMHLLHANLMELRNACIKSGARLHRESVETPRRKQPQPMLHDRDMSPGARPVASLRTKDRERDRQTPFMSSSRSSSRQGMSSTKLLPPSNGAGNNNHRKWSIASVASSAQRYAQRSDTESTSRLTRSNTLQSVESEDSMLFTQIYFKMGQALDLAGSACPKCEMSLTEQKRRSNSTHETALLEDALDKCRGISEQSRRLKVCMTNMRLEDPRVSESEEFWHLSNALTSTWAAFAQKLKGVGSLGLVTDEVKLLLRPVQISVKDASAAIKSSRWSRSGTSTPVRKNSISGASATTILSAIPPLPSIPSLALNTKSFNQQSNPSDPLSAKSSFSTHSSALSSGATTPLPATPLSAALGPAAMATMPSAGGSSNAAQLAANGSYFPVTNGVERQKSLRRP